MKLAILFLSFSVFSSYAAEYQCQSKESGQIYDIVIKTDRNYKKTGEVKISNESGILIKTYKGLSVNSHSYETNPVTSKTVLSSSKRNAVVLEMSEIGNRVKANIANESYLPCKVIALDYKEGQPSLE
jgi:hypothetical protein